MKQIAETGRLPAPVFGQISDEEGLTINGLRAFDIALRPQIHAISSQSEQNNLEQVLNEVSTLPRTGSPSAGVAASEPPLYYAVEAIPYLLASSGSVLARLETMRLLSAMFAGITALFAYLFIRDVLPGDKWAWAVGGLTVALVPLLGFMSGAVNPDSMLAAVSAASFYCLARAFRRGLGMGEAVAIGGVTAIGFLTKLNYLGLAPGILFGLAMLTLRAKKTSGRVAYRPVVLALGIALGPIALYLGVNLLSNHPVLGIVSVVFHLFRGSILDAANYIWQFYLPRIPGTANDFPGLFTPRQLWFNGFVGLYGWLDTPFPGWVDTVALIPAGIILALCGRWLLQVRGELRSHAPEIATYAIMAVGLMVLIGADSYRAFPAKDAEYAQARYLLPLLPLFGLVVAQAVRGSSRHWRPAVGVLVMVLILGQNIFSLLQVVARFYG